MAERDVLEQIRERADFVEIVSRYVALKKSGKNYIGPCPFHADKTPSFTVSPEKKLFHCFGCGAGGDLFQFVMKIEKLEFSEAVERLAQQLGVPLGRRAGSPLQKLKALNERVAAFYQTNLVSPAGAKARDYLKQRGFTKETIEKFQLGYALPRWDDLIKTFPKEIEALITVGLVLRTAEGKLYDRFRDRLIFPIWSLTGEMIGFAGRTLGDEEPKYLNIANTPLFEKGTVLYGLNFAREAARQRDLFVLVEGYTDVISAHQSGIENVVAGMGTALTSAQAQLLKRFASRVVLAYDRDAAGRAATLRGMANLRNAGIEVSVALLPDGFDPDGFLRAHGAEKFVRLLDRSVPFYEFYLSALWEEHDPKTVTGKERILQNLREFLPTLSSTALRYEIIREVARVLHLPEEEVARAVKAVKPAGIISPPSAPAWEHEEHVLYLVLQGDLKISELRDIVSVEDFTRYPEIARALWELGEGWTLEALLMRLSAEDQATVRRLVLSQPPWREGERPRARVEAPLRLRQRRIEERIARLCAQLHTAQRAGDHERVTALEAEHWQLVQARRRLLQGGRRMP
ncbi:MAG: DNA primase [Candidatus Bipolaricaulota bacterium]|nr:DNA primase [Candidatus Bipolaricaulota bacterium]MCS7275375.1 DNA primase [Candidatus Bipolaricaulota bacterium]MDW8110126.1 DNA primase [Candidatus Bipolaricaulota bacterium]MDW8328954.1 DNA primase [Candidatus Bipolaricaulota bacterium]